MTWGDNVKRLVCPGLALALPGLAIQIRARLTPWPVVRPVTHPETSLRLFIEHHMLTTTKRPHVVQRPDNRFANAADIFNGKQIGHPVQVDDVGIALIDLSHDASTFVTKRMHDGVSALELTAVKVTPLLL